MRTTLILIVAALAWIAVAASAIAADNASSRAASSHSVLATQPPVLSEYHARQPGDGIKFLIAALATGLLVLRTWRERRAGPTRIENAALGLLAIASVFAWWNFLQFHHPHYIHLADTFHYYIGARYFPELGYSRLYDCTEVANARLAGPRGQIPSSLRDLSTNTIVSSASILAEPERCTKHFSAERWRDFERDVAMFRNRLPPARWKRLLLDHGYNGTPFWTLVGGALAAGSGGFWSRVRWLTWIDPLLLLVMWGCAGWAFGWRGAAVGVIYWGTCYPGQFDWNGGAFLRQGWLAASVCGVCLAKREHYRAAGFLIAVAGLLRVFPALLALPIGIQVAARALRRQRTWLLPEHRKLLVGAACAIGVLLPASMLANGTSAWADFVRNSRLHLRTPLLNHAGLKTLVAFDPDTRSQMLFDRELTDPLTRWKQTRIDQSERRFWLYAAALAGFVVLLRFGANQPVWVLALLGVAAIPIATELTSYYMTVLCGFGLAASRRPVVGAALCALAASGWLFAFGWPVYDEHHALLSAAIVAFVGFATVVLSRKTLLP